MGPSLILQWASLWALDGPLIGPSMGLTLALDGSLLGPSMDLTLGPRWASLRHRIGPFPCALEVPPCFASICFPLDYQWTTIWAFQGPRGRLCYLFKCISSVFTSVTTGHIFPHTSDEVSLLPSAANNEYAF